MVSVKLRTTARAKSGAALGTHRSGDDLDDGGNDKTDLIEDRLVHKNGRLRLVSEGIEDGTDDREEESRNENARPCSEVAVAEGSEGGRKSSSATTGQPPHEKEPRQDLVAHVSVVSENLHAQTQRKLSTQFEKGPHRSGQDNNART